MIAYTTSIANFGAFLLEGCVLTFVVALPFLGVVILRRRRERRAERRRLRQVIDAKEWPRVTFCRSKSAEAKSGRVEAHTMPLGLCKLVRTGV